MKTVIQRIGTQLYLTGKNTWTEDERQAQDFGSSLRAFDFCLHRKIFDAEVVLTFSDPRYNIRLRAFDRSGAARLSRGRVQNAPADPIPSHARNEKLKSGAMSTARETVDP